MGENLKMVFMVFAIIFTFTNVMNLPIPNKYVIEALYLCLVFVIVIIILAKYDVAKSALIGNALVIHFVFISFVLAIISTLLTQYNFQQPLVYGFLSERRSLYSLVGIICYWLLASKKVSLVELEKGFVISMILLLIFYYVVNIAVSPSTLIGSSFHKVYHFAEYNAQRGVYRYRFDMSLVVFCVIYCLLRNRGYIYRILLLGSVVYVFLLFRGRIIMLFVSSLLLFYFVFKSKVNTKVLVFVLLPVLIAIYLLFDSHIKVDWSNFFQFFGDALYALIGTYSDDVSANSRIYQIGIALDHLEKYNFFGVGVPSYQWRITPDLVFGYFHPSDIGMLGVWVRYSFFSLLAYVYLVTRVLAWGRKGNSRSCFVNACYMYAIYLLVASLFTGWIFINSSIGQFSIVLAVISYDKYVNSKSVKIAH